MSLIVLMFVSTVIRLTSSQPTVDVTDGQNNDVCSSGQTDHEVLSVLNQLVKAVSQLKQNVSQLQADIAQMKAATGRIGKLRTQEAENKLMKRLINLKCSNYIFI